MSILRCIFFLLATVVSHAQAQITYWHQSSFGILVGCAIGAIILILVFSILFFGMRRRRRAVINRSARQYQNTLMCGGSQGRSQPAQQNSVPMAPYGPQGVAQAMYGNAPGRSDAALYNADYYSQGSPAPPPAYVNDTNVKGGYSPQYFGNGTEDQHTSGYHYSNPPFPPVAHVNGQENAPAGGSRS